jgi:hypothetical protein
LMKAADKEKPKRSTSPGCRKDYKNVESREHPLPTSERHPPGS